MFVPTSPSNHRAYLIEIDRRTVAFLRRFRGRINRQIEQERLKFLEDFCKLGWRSPNGQPLDVVKILLPEEIECLLSDSVNYRGTEYWVAGLIFIEHVANSSYRVEPPEIDPEGRPVLLRTTLVHRAAKTDRWELVRPLLGIYRHDVNFIDEESGLTHYHIACMAGLSDVERFIKHGQDPNGLVLTGTNDSPLHLALDYVYYNQAAKILMRRGADQNSVNAKGETPLHVICKRRHDAELLTQMFFDVCDELNRRVQVDARDNAGNTPLQSAVNNLNLGVAHFLGDRRGVDTSSFVFPTERHFDECVEFYAEERVESKWKLIPIVFGLVEFWEKKKNLDLVMSDVFAVMKFFIKLGVYMTSVKLSRAVKNDKWMMQQFRNKMKELEVREHLFLHDMLQSGVHAASRHFTYSDFLRIRESFGYFNQCDIYVHMKMYEIIMRGFFLHYAMKSFNELARFRLSFDCCEMIFNHELTNNDLYKICLATADESDRQNGEIDAMTNEINYYYV